MKKCLIASAVLAALSAVPVAAQAESDWTLSGNVAVTSDYVFRGISQSGEEAALQGGFDLTHSSGFYIGNWNSSISWLADFGGGSVSSQVEMDFYTGFRGSLGESLGFDVGYLYYYYPGDYPPGFTDPDTGEIYGSLTWGPATLKYSYATTDLFGVPNSDGSDYLELNLNFPFAETWAAGAHWGHQEVDGPFGFDYDDWKVSIAKTFGSFTVTAAYTDTDTTVVDPFGDDLAEGRFVLTFSGAF